MQAAQKPDLATCAFGAKIHEVDVERDVTYGLGGVGYDPAHGAKRQRELKLDIYRPRGVGPEPRPALILAFGGAFHRGSKSEEVFEGEAPSTAMAEYCREFARRGYICFSIEYRLMQEDPDPGITPVLPADLVFKSNRINYVRGILGLPPCTSQMLRNTIEASTDDMSKAVAFVRNRAGALGVDATRIAIGGFSAGGTIALHAAFAELAPVAAVVVISGRIGPPLLGTCQRAGMAPPPVLLFHGDNDLPDILESQEPMRASMKELGIANEFWVAPGRGHFYVRNAEVVAKDGGATSDVETTMAAFLIDRLGLADPGAGKMTVDRLQAFADAWNRHDIDDLMSFMTDDCTFCANGGSETYGTTFKGRAEVRRGYMEAWNVYPDAQWNNARHMISGDRAFSEWVFTGTDRSGRRVEVAGCDLFVLRGDKIVVKNSFRKRPA